MRDPHVVALRYRIEHRESVDYEKAIPLEEETDAFSVRMESLKAIFDMKEHHSSIESARQLVEQYTRAWEISAGLRDGPGTISFVFEDGDVVDLNPDRTNGVVIRTKTTNIAVSGHLASVHISRGSYPPPANEFKASSEVEQMYYQYVLFLEGKRALGAMAYLCLTVLEDSTGIKSGKRNRAVERYKISPKVLNKLGLLTESKGGQEARKARGLTADFTPEERRWLEETIRVFIRRAGEWASNPDGPHKEITMADLPSL